MPEWFEEALAVGSRAQHRRVPSAFGWLFGGSGEPLKPPAAELAAEREARAEDADDGVECNWDDMQLSNQPSAWKAGIPEIKWAYDNILKGQEIKTWFLGRTSKGECNDVTDTSRRCWYRSKLLNDVDCSAEDHCLHFAAHDGMNRHTYTCPTWVRDGLGRRCKLPPEWQPCPRKFTVKRVDSEVPQRFKAMLATSCGSAVKDQDDDAVSPEEQDMNDRENASAKRRENPTSSLQVEAEGAPASVSKVTQPHTSFATEEPSETCMGEEGATDDIKAKDAIMIFDVHRNKWYRCSEELRCEPWRIQTIAEGKGKCGETTCGEQDQCFEHFLSSKRSTKECIKGAKVWVISDSDDKAKVESYGSQPEVSQAQKQGLSVLACTMAAAVPQRQIVPPTGQASLESVADFL